MLQLERRGYFRISFSTILVLIAIYVKDADLLNSDLYRTIIYFTLFTMWGRSINARIIQKHSRRIILFICFLIIFWISIRMVKYIMIEDVHIKRYLWYLYYIPILMIPSSWFFLSISMGKPDNYKIEKKYYLVMAVSITLFLLVITNDLHQKVFYFNKGILLSNEEYIYGIVYFLVVIWNLLLGLSSSIILIYKSRIPSTNKLGWLAIIPTILMFIYTLGYILSVEICREGILSDMTIVNCLGIVGVIEGSMHTGLIMVNTRYEEIFKASTISACIVDKKYNEYLVSDAYKGFPKEILKKTEGETPIIDGSLRLSSLAIRGGRIIWQEDVKGLLEAIEELKIVKENLEEGNAIVYEEYKLKKRQHQIEEMNKLYTRIEEGTKEQIESLSKLLEELKEEEVEENKIAILSKMALIGAYIKRRNNLVFIEKTMDNISEEEINLSFKESMDNLEFLGVACGLRIKIEGKPRTDVVLRLYDFFEAVVEASIPKLEAIQVNISDKDGVKISINVDKLGSRQFLQKYKKVEIIEDEDEEIKLIYRGD